MAENHFLLPEADYQRAINPIGDWIRQTACYASKMTGKPYEACVEHLKKKLKDQTIPFRNPQVVFFERGENGDRERIVAPHTHYMRDTLQRGDILAPTATTYLHPTVQRSLVAEFLDDNVKLRKELKKKSQAYEHEGNKDLYLYYHNGQDSAKRDNNAVSGGFVAEGSVIQNKSAHSTLTSTTRSLSSLSNASNERLIEGNRHYYSFQIALNNLISIVDRVNRDDIEAAMTKYNLAYPTVDQVMDCVTRSTSLYFRDRKVIAKLRSFVERLSPVERAAVVYTGDLYHVRVLNDAFMRLLVADFSRRGDATPIPGVEDPVTYIRSTDEAVVNFAHQVCISLLEGIGKKYEKVSEDTRWILANTCRNIVDTITHYKEFFKAFFLTLNSPATIATIPRMIRRSVVLSDTDSTMFSVDGWVTWYTGRIAFTDNDYAVAGTIAFIATQSIAHIIAILSANMNVERKRLFLLAMKPEYVFPVFALTSVAKHYYTAMKVKEGDVYKDIKMERKGVHMKDSSVPVTIIKSAAEIMEDVIRTVMRGDKIAVSQKLKQAADMEREIGRSILSNEVTYLKRTKIKEHTAYKVGEKAEPWLQYLLWQEVFAPKYGKAPAPPYNAVRLPLDLPNATAMKNWLLRIEDQALAERLTAWLLKYNKKILGSVTIPMEQCLMNGIPPELKMVLDTKKITLTLTKSYRNILESLGFFSKHNLTYVEQGY